jgi:ketosteroid isomerase-like protein
MVQELWSAFEERGVAGVMERAGDDVVWRPGLAEGASLRGRKEALDFFAKQQREGVTVQARPYRFEQHGPCVIVTGSLRVREHGGFSESSRVWLYRFEEGRLTRAEHYSTRAEALAACDS